MRGLYFVPLKGLNGFPAALTAGLGVLTVDGGVRIHEIAMLGNAGAAQAHAAGFGDINFYVGDNLQRVMTITEWEAGDKIFGASHGAIYDSGAVGAFQKSLYFSEPYRKTYAAQERYALDLERNEKCRIEVNVLAAATTGSVSFMALVEDLDDVRASGRTINRTPDNGYPIFEKYFRKSSIGVSGTSAQINDLLKKDRYSFLDFYDPAVGAAAANTNISQVKITKGTEVIWDASKKSADAILTRQGMTPVSGRYTIVPELNDNPMNVWNFTNEKKVEIELTFAAGVTAGSSVKLITRRYGPPE